MVDAIAEYNARQSAVEREVCDRLRDEITRTLPDAQGRIWHGSPVWFLDGNPVVGYSKLKAGIQLLFWSGASFGEDMKPIGKFKAAGVRYSDAGQINVEDLTRWLMKARVIQWNYRDIVKRQGELVRLT